MTDINIDAPYEEFVAQLASRQWSEDALETARLGLNQRIVAITAQIACPERADNTGWLTSSITARKYFQRKLNAISGALLTLRTSTLPAPAKKPAGGHGFLLTFVHKGEHFVVATRRNPAEVWADMLAEEDLSTPPALVAFLSLTEDAAKQLPPVLWADDL